MPKVLRVNPQNPEPHVLRVVTEIISNGGVVIYATDTLYGLGCNALDSKAVLRVFKIKNRPLNKALPVAVADLEMAENYAFVTEEAKKLIKAFWPGALTIILNKKMIVPSEVTSGQSGIGLRAPDHMVPLSIIRESNLPIVTTSANKHGCPNSVTVEDAISQIGEDVDLVLDSGRSEIHVASTVIDLTKKSPVIVRKGLVNKGSVEAVLGFKIK